MDTQTLLQLQWHFSGTGLAVLARVPLLTGIVAKQADLATIVYTVRDKTSGALTANSSLTISAVIFDALQTGDVRWTRDASGWNFLHYVAATELPDPNRQYRVFYLFTPAAGGGGAARAVGFGINVPTRPATVWGP